jgi:hypothetical protein
VPKVHFQSQYFFSLICLTSHPCGNSFYYCIINMFFFPTGMKFRNKKKFRYGIPAHFEHCKQAIKIYNEHCNRVISALFLSLYRRSRVRKWGPENRYLKSFQSNALRKMAVFWDVAPCSLVEIVQRFAGAFCLRRESDDIMTASIYIYSNS